MSRPSCRGISHCSGVIRPDWLATCIRQGAMIQHLARTIDHALSLLRTMAEGNPEAQRKLREASALLHAAADAVASAAHESNRRAA